MTKIGAGCREATVRTEGCLQTSAKLYRLNEAIRGDWDKKGSKYNG